jgi:methanogenic corrinoid protein MtbC1
VPPANVPWHALQPAQEVFLAAILNGDRATALRIVRAAQKAGHSMLDVNVGIIMQALHEVGHLWETNRISVAVEHMATAAAQYVVARLDEHLAANGDDRGTILITGVQGERHQIGAEMATRVLEADGWTVRYLGTHLPPASILHAVSTVNPDILAVSATMLHNLPAVGALLHAVHEQYGERRPRIAICGAVVQHVPDIAGVVGADRSIRGLQDALPVMLALFADGQAPAAGGI